MAATALLPRLRWQGLGAWVCEAVFCRSSGRVLDQTILLFSMRESDHVEAKRLLAEVFPRSRENTRDVEISADQKNLAAGSESSSWRALAAGVKAAGEKDVRVGDENISRGF